MNTLTVKKIKLTKEQPIVCVPVIASNGEDIIDRIRQLSSDRVPMIEWRLDHYEDHSNLDSVAKILDTVKNDVRGTILLLTLRTKSEGGKADISGDELLRYYKELSGLRGFDVIDLQYNDVDRDTADTCCFNKKITILSYHNFSRTPEDDELDVVLSGMIEFQCDIIKLALTPQSEDDVERTIDFSCDVRRRWHGRQIIISMGALGERLRRNPFVTGSCITFGCIEGEASAPGQVGYRELGDGIIRTARKRGIIFLIGYMGTGKSTIGRELCHTIRRRLIDLDSLIERNEGSSISVMMAENGEEYFRDIETNTLLSLEGRHNLIVSCGGGVILREKNREFMKKNGTVVLLEATPEVIYSRIKDDSSRPLLKNKMSVEYIASMKLGRDPLYRECADIVIETGGLDKFDISAKICKTIGCCL